MTSWHAPRRFSRRRPRGVGELPPRADRPQLARTRGALSLLCFLALWGRSSGATADPDPEPKKEAAETPKATPKKKKKIDTCGAAVDWTDDFLDPKKAGKQLEVRTSCLNRRTWKDMPVAECKEGHPCSSSPSMPFERGMCVKNAESKKMECWDICNVNHKLCEFKGPDHFHGLLRVKQARLGLLGDVSCPCLVKPPEKKRRKKKKIEVEADKTESTS
eukprot:TRINITY_DN50_c1_g1_i1.p2 TRINITY_DN50_c1_g1~~TRINITY_DN50_c1_g1_i1.p2  ORF type:complete len:218 (+),score=50.03 TRINITY_DN50_c1_g1_i1:62-715(+)